MPPKPATPTPICNGQDLFKTQCDGCHVKMGIGKLDLFSPGMMERLVGKMPVTGTCKDRPLIDAALSSDGKPTGVFFDRMTGSTCGTPMPFGAPLGAADMECVLDWAASQMK